MPPPARVSAWQAWGRHAVLFVTTVASVYLTGGWLLVIGLLSILLCHEMGHYFACRYYGVDATLPFLIPAPFTLLGTFGAVIRIRGRIPHRRALFDIGIAGPLAGFAVCLPVLLFGVREAEFAAAHAEGLYLGDPLLFQWAVDWLKGSAPPDSTLVIGPLGLAAWGGLFVTALNLIPIGQLDGGHVTYALFRERAHALSRIVWWIAVGLIYFAPAWILWAVLVRILGRRHPPTLDDGPPVGRGRAIVALVGLAVFVVCFVPSPVLGSWQTLAEAFRQLTSR